MEKGRWYEEDVLRFFGERLVERELYETLYVHMEKRLPDGLVKVQKSQISFYHKHLFAAVSMPVRRRKGWPEPCVIVTLGLNHPLQSSRVAVKVEPYPGRWTNHVLLSRPEEVDDELMCWLEEAYQFAQAKGRGEK